MNMVAGRSAIALTDLRDARAQSCRDRARGGGMDGFTGYRSASRRPSRQLEALLDRIVVVHRVGRHADRFPQWTQQLITWCT